MLKILTVLVLSVATSFLLECLGWYNGVAADLQPVPMIDKDNVVRQSTAYTCGAAASATLLRRLKIAPEATESQLAPLCMTRRLDGATSLGLAVGLKTIAEPKGWRIGFYTSLSRFLPKNVSMLRYFLRSLGSKIVTGNW